MINLDIILRTHDRREIHVQKEQRYCGTSKPVLIEKCVTSLIRSAIKAKDTVNSKIYWLDDNSTENTIDRLKNIFVESNFKFEYIPLEVSGWNYSSLRQFEIARDSTADLVYIVEDDYLHFETAIGEMVESQIQFSQNMGKQVAIHPFDDPDNYLPQWLEPCRVVNGKNRHWRTNLHSTFTMMIPPEIVKKNWSTFYTLATEYGTVWGEQNNIHEGTTINRLWRESTPLFTPIPSLALHMQYDAQKDPYIDWKKLWDSI